MSIAEMLTTLASSIKSRLDAINEALSKKGQSEALTYDDIPAKIEAIETGVDVSSVTAGENDVLYPKVFINSSGEQKTGIIRTKTRSDLLVSGDTVTTPEGYYASSVSKSVDQGSMLSPSISVDENGLITASSEVESSGYMESGVQMNSTYQLDVKSGETFIPSTAEQVIPKGKYLTGDLIIEGDQNLTSANIAEGKTIFGVSGTHQGGNATFGTCYTATRSGYGVITFDGVPTANLIGFVVFLEGSMSSSSTTKEEVVFIVYYGSTSLYYISTHYDSLVDSRLEGGFINISMTSDSVTIDTDYSSTNVRFKSDMPYNLFPVYSK